MARHLVLTLALILSACGGRGGNNSGGAGIPGDIPFNEKALPGINDADFAQAKLVASTAGQASAPLSQVLIDGDETQRDTKEREDDFAKLRPEVQALVREWQTLCKPKHVKTGKGIDGTPRAGEVYKSGESNEATGARCPVEMSEKMESVINVAQFTQNPLTFTMNISATGSGRAVYREGADRAVIGASTLDMAFSVTGRFEHAKEVTNSYTKMSAGGTMETLNLGQLRFEMSVESLDRPNLEKTLTTFRVSQGGRTYLFTQFFDQSNKVQPFPRFFIGNRELTLDEVRAMGEFPFTPHEDRQMPRVFGR